jgi:hypothetical protein
MRDLRAQKCLLLIHVRRVHGSPELSMYTSYTGLTGAVIETVRFSAVAPSLKRHCNVRGLDRGIEGWLTHADGSSSSYGT